MITLSQITVNSGYTQTIAAVHQKKLSKNELAYHTITAPRAKNGPKGISLFKPNLLFLKSKRKMPAMPPSQKEANNIIIFSGHPKNSANGKAKLASPLPIHLPSERRHIR